MYSTKDAERLSGVPGRTLRRYCQQFGEFLSRGAAQSGRKRKFTEGDINTLQTIRMLFNENLSAEDVRAALGDKSITKSGSLPLIPAGLSSALSKIDDKFQDHDSRLGSHDDRISDLERSSQEDRAWRQYQRDLAAWKALPRLQRWRTPEPKPPE